MSKLNNCFVLTQKNLIYHWMAKGVFDSDIIQFQYILKKNGSYEGT